MGSKKNQLFLSYSGDDSFEASLLQFAIEHLLAEHNAKVWTYQRDQPKNQRSIGKSLKDRVRGSTATIFLVSPSTLASGAAQWMELAYSDAFDVPTFVLLHHLTFAEIKAREKGVPPLLLEGQCNSSAEWKSVVADMGSQLNASATRSRC